MVSAVQYMRSKVWVHMKVQGSRNLPLKMHDYHLDYHVLIGMILRRFLCSWSFVASYVTCRLTTHSQTCLVTDGLASWDLLWQWECWCTLAPNVPAKSGWLVSQPKHNVFNTCWQWHLLQSCKNTQEQLTEDRLCPTVKPAAASREAKTDANKALHSRIFKFFAKCSKLD